MPFSVFIVMTGRVPEGTAAEAEKEAAANIIAVKPRSALWMFNIRNEILGKVPVWIRADVSW